MTAKENLQEEIELCATCKAGLIFYLPGDENAKRPYCPKCGAKGPGIMYVRKDLVTPA